MQQVARIDRIVLYVDDLDRCPPDRVVEVLQAVHVLLAMKLFVVVVAVDSRWLISSVSDHYQRLLAGSSSRDRLYNELTPLSYLEKIFQVPYLVPAMGQTGFTQLLRELVSVEASAEEQLEQRASSIERAKDEPEGQRKASESQAPLLPTAGTEPTSPRSKGDAEQRFPATQQLEPLDLPALSLSRAELEFMETLHPLVRTPRAAKMFVNVYMVFRGTLEHPLHGEPSLDEFLTNELYPVPMLLLALQMGHPRFAEIFDKTISETTTLEACLEQLSLAVGRELLVRAARDGNVAGVAGEVPRQLVPAGGGHGRDRLDSTPSVHSLSGEELARAQQALALIARLQSSRSGASRRSRDDVSTYIEWLPRTRRFSFSAWGRQCLSPSADELISTPKLE
ncbi:MAG: P-loop NTPase fold protein [Polyangiaceae bacterium]